MKPVAAIVEPAFDVELSFSKISVSLAGERDAENSAKRHEGLAANARETAALRRRETGLELLKIRGAWPKHGPGSSGWTDFLKRLRLDDSTALRYMEQARTSPIHGQPGNATQKPSVSGTPANVHGGSGEVKRGTYCTPKKYAEAVGPWDLDPFSNPRSHIVATHRCMLEDGGDGLLDAEPGLFRAGGDALPRVAESTWRVFIQPDYQFVEEAIAHYKHTRFCALLRFAPDTGWFAAMWPHVRVLAIPTERIPFEAPDGIEADGAPYPHAFYYADERDVTDAIRALCIVLRVEHPNT
ncbi:MAG: hypothetical protein ACM358_04955 [Gemmatimonadota bacterium]